MNKYKLEQLTSSVAVVFLTILSIGGIILIADQIFRWNIFPPNLEKIIGFLMFCLGIIIASSVLVNIMINISIIARKLTEIVEQKNHDKK